MAKTRYEKFDLPHHCRMAENYLTSMVDEDFDYLPYWLIAAHENPAFVEHCRVDDAELVASWYEAAVATRQVLGEKSGKLKEVEDAFWRHMMKSWGEHGLRFHEDYPWTHTNHSSFHEMAYILSALNRRLANRPDDKEAEKRARNLVRGMRKLVIERKTRTFWSGDSPVNPQPCYEFPNDVYLRDGGFDMTCCTGRGEEPIRNGMMLHALVVRYDQAGDRAAFDLARGIANHLLTLSRYFNVRMEFFGHIHSAMWVASGLVRLGRLDKCDWYIEKGKAIYDYVRSLSSSFGWVPEFAQWRPADGEFCETCCIKDMIQCATELIDAGFDEYWSDVNLFGRNQLVENQIRDGCFVATDNSMPDTVERSYKDIDKRIVGGWSGGSEPNSISLKKFRSIAGCCVGTAPQALQIVWDRVCRLQRGRLTVNMPIEKDDRHAAIEVGYPNEGFILVTPKRDCELAIRIHPWMPKKLTAAVAGRARKIRIEDGLAILGKVKRGQTAELKHPLRLRVAKEHCRARTWTVTWSGPDVVDISPKGAPLRLYQRVEGKKKVYPKPARQRTTGTGFAEKGPTNMKR